MTRCLVPDCNRRDIAQGAYLCPGHAFLFQGSRFASSGQQRLDAIEEWLLSLARPAYKNGTERK